jgi:hypothetical protein
MSYANIRVMGGRWARRGRARGCMDADPSSAGCSAICCCNP